MGASGDAAADSGFDLSVLQRRINSLRTLESAQWREVEVDGPVPPGRLWHSVTAVGDKDQVVIFGGVSSTSGDMLDDTWVLDLPTEPGGRGRWRQVFPIDQLRPEPRAHHDASVVAGRWLVVHGGLLQNGARLSDTWRLDLTEVNPEWEELGGNRFAPRPMPRYHHSMLATSSGKLVVFGGHNYARVALGDAWVMDAGSGNSPPTTRWRQAELSRNDPDPRAYQAAVVLGEYVLVCGGELQDGGLNDHFWVFDPADRSWHPVSVVDAEGVAVSDVLGAGGRMRHSACVVDEASGIIAMCGGHGVSMAEARPIDCLLLRFSKVSGTAINFQCEVLKRPTTTPSNAEGAPLGPRRDAALLRLGSCHLALFGGNDASVVDQFGDGYHQKGCEETLVGDASRASIGNAGEWHCVARGAPDSTSMGSAVTSMPYSDQLIVVDHVADGKDVVRVLTLSIE